MNEPIPGYEPGLSDDIEADCPCGYRAGSRPTQIGCGAKECPNRTESDDSVMETGADMGGTSTAEATNWWADCFPQWRNDHA